MGDRPFAYICSPFRGDTESDAAKARDYCRQAFEAGYAPIAPHTIFTQFLSDADPKEQEASMAMGIALMPLCRVLLICGDDITEGMKAEIGHAQRLGIETCTLENIPPRETEPLSKNQFWQMIDDARERASGWQGMCTPLIEALGKLDAPDIIRFKQIFNEYQDLAYKEELWSAATVINGYCSNDGFIDFRAWLIAQGKEVYLNALAEPDSLADHEAVKACACEVIASNFIMPSKGYYNAADFEVLSYAPSDAYKNKTGGDMYKRLDDNPLSEQEKADIASEVIYAVDIDATFGGFDTPQHEVRTALERLVPNLVKVFSDGGVSEVVSEAAFSNNCADTPRHSEDTPRHSADTTKRPTEKESVLAELAESRKVQGKAPKPHKPHRPPAPNKKKPDLDL